MMKAIQIDKEMVTLCYEIRNGKVFLGNLIVLPVGLWQQLQASKNELIKIQSDEEIHQPRIRP